MPYINEPSSKFGHLDILTNPDVREFLETCSDIPEPSREDIRAMTEGFREIPPRSGELPNFVLAIDGSSYEAAVDKTYPSRRLGYIKIGSVLLDMEGYCEISRAPTRFVDPMKINELLDKTAAISMVLPGAYVPTKGADTVRTGFRAQLSRYFVSDSTKVGGRVLLNTLVKLLDFSDYVIEREGKQYVTFDRCPNQELGCEYAGTPVIEVAVELGKGDCPSCGTPVFVSDKLRLHEAFIENGPNQEALTRVMNAVEHLLMAHYVDVYATKNPTQLSSLCILVDGPLALFGEPAKLHRSLMKLLDEVRQRLKRLGLPEPLIFGMQKTGRLKEHFDLIDRSSADGKEIVKNGSYLLVSDAYRYEFIEPNKMNSTRNFGDDTYYGQDLLVKTESGKRFVICLPYNEAGKQSVQGEGGSVSTFRERKADIENYPTLGRVMEVVRELESDLYQASMIPVVLAHRHASISRTPGGKVLDILSGQAFGKS